MIWCPVSTRILTAETLATRYSEREGTKKIYPIARTPIPALHRQGATDKIPWGQSCDGKVGGHRTSLLQVPEFWQTFPLVERKLRAPRMSQ